MKEKTIIILELNELNELNEPHNRETYIVSELGNNHSC